MKRSVWISGALLLAWAQAAFGEPVPTLEIERQVWALDEDVFFWSGLRSDGELRPEDIEGCGVEVTAPDGSIDLHPALWPADGNPSRGWSAGHGLSAAETIEGVYRVRAFCGETSLDGSFEVRRMEILDQIEFRIDIDPGCREDPNDETVTWVVENRSIFPLLVAPPGSLMSNTISFRIRHRETGSIFDAFVPADVLGIEPHGPGDVVVEDLGWEDLRWLEPDRAAAGETLKRRFCLTDLRESVAESAWPPGFLAVSASTQVLVGPRDGPWAEAGPFRLSATAERTLPPLLDSARQGPHS